MIKVFDYAYKSPSIIEESAKISEATWEITTKGTDYVLLTDEKSKLSGFVFDVMIAASIGKGISPEEQLAKIADRRILKVDKDSPADGVIREMMSKKIPVVAVVENDKVVGGFCLMNATAACADNLDLFLATVTKEKERPIIEFSRGAASIVSEDINYREAGRVMGAVAPPCICLLILDEKGLIKGMINEKEIVRAIAFEENLEGKVEKIRTDVDVVKKNTGIYDTVKILKGIYAKKNVRCIPIVDEKSRPISMTSPIFIYFR